MGFGPEPSPAPCRPTLTGSGRQAVWPLLRERQHVHKGEYGINALFHIVLLRPMQVVNLLPSTPQAPMSRVEPDEFVNDRYDAIEKRLGVSTSSLEVHASGCLRPRHERAEVSFEASTQQPVTP